MGDPLASLSASGPGNPFSGNSIAPNFTTSQTEAQKINSSISGGRVDLGTYIAGTGPNIGPGGAAIPWGLLGLLAFLGGVIFFWRRKKAKE